MIVLREFAQAAGISLADAADFLKLCRRSVKMDDLVEVVVGFVEATTPEPAPAPELAPTVIRPAEPPDPGDPDPEANTIRAWQWPAHCGQWFALVGTPGHRRSVQYGPMRTAAECLEHLARNLAARGHRFDGGYEPPR